MNATDTGTSYRRANWTTRQVLIATGVIKPDPDYVPPKRPVVAVRGNDVTQCKVRKAAAILMASASRHV